MSQVLEQLQKGHIKEGNANDNPGILNENAELFFKTLSRESKQDKDKNSNVI